MLNFKKFIEENIAMKGNALLRHIKAQQFKSYVDAIGCLVMKYKVLYTNDEWLFEIVESNCERRICEKRLYSCMDSLRLYNSLPNRTSMGYLGIH